VQRVECAPDRGRDLPVGHAQVEVTVSVSVS
jgi:hypothetical protein